MGTFQSMMKAVHFVSASESDVCGFCSPVYISTDLCVALCLMFILYNCTADALWWWWYDN